MLWLAAASWASGATIYFDNFEQFTSGTEVPDGTTYIPSSGPTGASANVTLLPGSKCTMTNFMGSIRALFDCPTTTITTNWNSYQANLASAQSNQVLEITWQLNVAAIKLETLGWCGVQLPTLDDEVTVLAIADGGQIYAITNVMTSLSDLVTIGSWSGLVGTVMTNHLVLNYLSRTMTYALNGTTLANLPMRPDLTNCVTLVNFEFDEIDSYGATGNTFALDSVKVESVTTSPPVLSIAWSNGSPRLNLSGVIGCRYAVDYKTSLAANNNWQSLATNLLWVDPLSFTDTNAIGNVRRFYRARFVQ
jgi:hypothetical protein